MNFTRPAFSIWQVFSVIVALVFQAPAISAPISPERSSKFEKFSVADGLSQGSVHSILQDRQGFLWFGTGDGLNRYDGYAFTAYKHETSDSTSISSDWVLSIYEDSAGLLWLGTFSGGLNRFERTTESFVRYVHDPSNPQSLSDNKVNTIFEDHTGALWLGTENGLNLIDRTNNTFRRFLPDSSNPNSLSHPTVCAIFEDRAGTLWIGTEGGGLNRFDRDSKKFTHFRHDPGDARSLGDDIVRAIYEDSAGRLWIGTGRGGLNHFDRDTGAFARFPHETENPHGLNHPEVRSICEDRAGTLWLGTLGGGLNRFDPISGQFFHYISEPKNPTSLSNDRVFSIRADRSGTLWIGTDNGLNKLDPGQAPFTAIFNELENSQNASHNIIWAACKDRRGVLWIGTENGLFRRARDERGHQQVTYFSNLSQKHYENKINVIYEDRRGMLWIGTDYVLKQFDPTILAKKGNEKTALINWENDSSNPPVLSRLQIFSICEDSIDQNVLWIGTSGGLYRLQRDAQGQFQSTVFRHDPQNPNSIGSDNLRPLLIDRTGTLWVGTWHDGLNRFDRSTGQFQRLVHDPNNANSLCNDVIRSIYEDSAGRLWIGTDDGLDLYDRATGHFKHYSERDGLPSNAIWGILEDNHGFLWLSTNNGISRFDPQAQPGSAFKNYTIRDGLSHQEFNRGAWTKGHDGEMFFGGMHGLTSFHPDSIKDNPFLPQIVISACWRYNTDDANGIPIVEKGIFARQQIELSYKDNIITFEFASLNFRNPEKNQYAYKLEGYREQWIQLGTHREATFTNLDPGEYVLRVKGSNNDGIWNADGASLKIIITPPWWQTWWAYTFYVLFVAAAIYGLWRDAVNRIHLKNQAKIEHLETQKLKELDQFKSRFFANISHEFRTPLTLILGPIEQMLAAGKGKVVKQELKMVRDNAASLLRLVNQLLDLARLEAGRLPLRLRPADFIPFLRNLTMAFASLAERRNISLLFHAEARSLPTLFDHDAFEKIFYNLLSNAFKFTPDGGKISVSVELPGSQENSNGHDGGIKRIQSQLGAPAATWVTITVKDTGIGIPADRLPHVFDRFYQVAEMPVKGTQAAGTHIGSARRFEGTGIGLSLSKELVELHHGTIEISSTEGFGTEVVVGLPLGKAYLREEEIVADDNAQEKLGQEPGHPARLGGSEAEFYREADPAIQISGDDPIVLLIEDNADMRRYLRTCLESGYQIIEAVHGEAGLQLAREWIPDLVICDVMMPRMDGFELCAELKNDEKTAHLPVILLTARAGEEDRLEGLETGADAFLTKPFNARELLVLAASLVRLRRKLREKFSTESFLESGRIADSRIDEAFLKRVTAVVEKNIGDEAFSVETLAEQLGMSRTQLHRKLSAITNQPASHFIRSLRLHHARKLLRQDGNLIHQVAFMVGFGSHAYFSKCFHDEFGCTPSEFIRVYRSE